MAMTNENLTSIFIGGLHPRVTNALLLEILEEEAPIVCLKIISDPKTGISKGFAFFKVKTEEIANIFTSRDFIVMGRTLQCRINTKSKPPSPRNRIFLGGLPNQTNDLFLKQFFSKFGKVRSAYVIRNPDTKRSKGFGFVDFLEDEAVEKTLQFGQITMFTKIITVKRYRVPEKISSQARENKEIKCSGRTQKAINGLDCRKSESNQTPITKWPPSKSGSKQQSKKISPQSPIQPPLISLITSHCLKTVMVDKYTQTITTNSRNSLEGSDDSNDENQSSLEGFNFPPLVVGSDGNPNISDYKEQNCGQNQYEIKTVLEQILERSCSLSQQIVNIRLNR